MSFCFYLENDNNCAIYDVKCQHFPKCEKCKDYEPISKNNDRICNLIVSYCGQCPNRIYYDADKKWICKKTFEHLETLKEFGEECPLQEVKINE